jgi:hypothetical protein
MQNVAGVTLDTLDALDALDTLEVNPSSERVLEAPAMVRVICLLDILGSHQETASASRLPEQISKCHDEACGMSFSLPSLQNKGG